MDILKKIFRWCAEYVLENQLKTVALVVCAATSVSIGMFVKAVHELASTNLLVFLGCIALAFIFGIATGAFFCGVPAFADKEKEKEEHIKMVKAWAMELPGIAKYFIKLVSKKAPYKTNMSKGKFNDNVVKFCETYEVLYAFNVNELGVDLCEITLSNFGKDVMLYAGDVINAAQDTTKIFDNS